MVQSTVLTMFLALILVYLQNTYREVILELGHSKGLILKKLHPPSIRVPPKRHVALTCAANCLKATAYLKAPSLPMAIPLRPQSKSKDSGLPLGSDLNPFSFKTYIWHLKRRKQEKQAMTRADAANTTTFFWWGGQGFCGPSGVSGHP